MIAKLRNWTEADWTQLDGVDEILASRIVQHLKTHDLPEDTDELLEQLESVLMIGQMRRALIKAGLEKWASEDAPAATGEECPEGF